MGGTAPGSSGRQAAACCVQHAAARCNVKARCTQCGACEYSAGTRGQRRQCTLEAGGSSPAAYGCAGAERESGPHRGATWYTRGATSRCNATIVATCCGRVATRPQVAEVRVRVDERVLRRVRFNLCSLKSEAHGIPHSMVLHSAVSRTAWCSTRHGIGAQPISRAAWYPAQRGTAEHGIPRGMVSRTADIPCGMVSRTAWYRRAWYPTRRGIPHSTVSRTAWYRRAW